MPIQVVRIKLEESDDTSADEFIARVHRECAGKRPLMLRWFITESASTGERHFCVPCEGPLQPNHPW